MHRVGCARAQPRPPTRADALPVSQRESGDGKTRFAEERFHANEQSESNGQSDADPRLTKVRSRFEADHAHGRIPRDRSARPFFTSQRAAVDAKSRNVTLVGSDTVSLAPRTKITSSHANSNEAVTLYTRSAFHPKLRWLASATASGTEWSSSAALISIASAESACSSTPSTSCNALDIALASDFASNSPSLNAVASIPLQFAPKDFAQLPNGVIAICSSHAPAPISPTTAATASELWLTNIADSSASLSAIRCDVLAQNFKLSALASLPCSSTKLAAFSAFSGFEAAATSPSVAVFDAARAEHNDALWVPPKSSCSRGYLAGTCLSDGVLAGGTLSGRVDLWDTRAQELSTISSFSAPLVASRMASRVRCVAGDEANAWRVAAGFSDGRVVLWDRRRSELPIEQLHSGVDRGGVYAEQGGIAVAHDGAVWDLRFVSGGLVSCGEDGRVLRWMLQPDALYPGTSIEVRVVKDADGYPVSSVDMLPSTELLAFAVDSFGLCVQNSAAS